MDTSVMEEKQFNPRLSKTKVEFVEIMNNLNLPYPKQIGEVYFNNLRFNLFFKKFLMFKQIKLCQLIKCAACITCLPNW